MNESCIVVARKEMNCLSSGSGEDLGYPKGTMGVLTRVAKRDFTEDAMKCKAIQYVLTRCYNQIGTFFSLAHQKTVKMLQFLRIGLFSCYGNTVFLEN